MTQEEKQLLLIDLCARLPYGVKCQIDYDNEDDADLGIERYCDDRIVSVCVETGEIGLYEASEYFYPGEIKPYLRPMSSMTEEEKEEQSKIVMQSMSCSLDNSESATTMLNDWLLSKHFDVRGLISKGLALVAKEGTYKTE